MKVVRVPDAALAEAYRTLRRKLLEKYQPDEEGNIVIDNTGNFRGASGSAEIMLSVGSPPSGLAYKKTRGWRVTTWRGLRTFGLVRSATESEDCFHEVRGFLLRLTGGPVHSNSQWVIPELEVIVDLDRDFTPFLLRAPTKRDVLALAS